MSQYQVLSVCPTEFADKVTGEVRKMWQVYMADDIGKVGSVFSAKEIHIGDLVSLTLAVNRDGRFAAKIVG